MRSISLPQRLFSGLLPVLLVTACGDPNALPAAQFENVVDTTTLYALTGTPLGTPSGFDSYGVIGNVGVAVRTDLNDPFDFAVDLDATGTLVLYPTGALGLAAEPGIVLSTGTFEGVTSAPLEGYVLDSAVVAPLGTVFVLRSRSSTQACALAGAFPRYSKFHVLAIDAAERTVTLEFLVDPNCGYRGLEPGLPDD
jgi:hypothetical protein